MAAPTFIAKGTDYGSDTGSVQPTCPASILAGDLLLLVVFSHDGVGTGGWTTPAGWTSMNSGNYKNSTPVPVGAFQVFYRVADGTEDSSVVTVNSFGHTTGVDTMFMGQIYQFRGDVDGITIEDDAINVTGDGATSMGYNALTLGGPERTLIAIGASAYDTTISGPAGYTEVATDQDFAGDVDMVFDVYTLEDVSAGPAINGSGGTTDGWATMHISIYSTPAAPVATGRSFIIN